MEFDTLYCDVIVQLWEAFTGKKAVLAWTEIMRLHRRIAKLERGAGPSRPLVCAHCGTIDWVRSEGPCVPGVVLPRDPSLPSHEPRLCDVLCKLCGKSYEAALTCEKGEWMASGARPGQPPV